MKELRISEMLKTACQSTRLQIPEDLSVPCNLTKAVDGTFPLPLMSFFVMYTISCIQQHSENCETTRTGSDGLKIRNRKYSLNLLKPNDIYIYVVPQR